MNIAHGVAAVLVLALASTLEAQNPAVRSDSAPQVLAAAREALGGEKNLLAVKTFIATGRARQIRGANLVPIEFEISCELPNKYVRRDEIPAQDTDIAVAGFDGEQLIQFPIPQRGQQGPARIVGIKQDFARLTLGVFAASSPAYPVTFQYVAEAEAPEGKADVLDVVGPSNFAARLVVQRSTHLPVMLIWRGPAPGQPMPVEYRLYYGDYREVNGIKWPFRIRRAVAGETVEETTFDKVQINAKINPKKFEAPK